jgi:hypothetical protein
VLGVKRLRFRNISRVKAVVDNYWDDTDKFVKQNKHRNFVA